MEKDDFKVIDKAILEIAKKFGQDRIVKIDDNNTKIEKWKLESINFNYLLGGGLPKGRVIELSGEESSGKTLLSILWAIDIQKQGGFVVFFDYEYSFDPEFYKKIGLNLSQDKFLLIQPDSLEEGFTMIEELSKTNKISLIIIDSSNAAKSNAEGEKDFSEFTIGSSARAWSTGLKKIVAVLSRTKTTMIIISQIRLKIGVMMGDPRVRGVGNSIKFYSSIRCDVKRVGYDEANDKEVSGITMKIKAFKNKCGVPMREIETAFDFEKGFDMEKEITDFAITFNLIEKTGSWFTLPNGKRFQGKENVASYLKEDTKMRDDLKLKITNLVLKENELIEQQKEIPLKREKPVIEEKGVLHIIKEEADRDKK